MPIIVMQLLRLGARHAALHYASCGMQHTTCGMQHARLRCRRCRYPLQLDLRQWTGGARAKGPAASYSLVAVIKHKVAKARTAQCCGQCVRSLDL